MPDEADAFLSGSTVVELFSCYNALVVNLSPETRKQLGRVFMSYSSMYGFDGLFQRVNGRTVSQVLAEFVPGDMEPIASGDQGGVRYALYSPAPVDTHAAETPEL